MRKLAGLLAVLCLAAAAAVGYWTRLSDGPIGPVDARAIVEVPRGMGFARLPEHLAAYGVVSDPRGLGLWLRVRRPEGTLKAGEYELSGAMTPAEAVGRLTSGKVVLRPFTVPEGLTLAEIAALAEERGVAAADAMLRPAKDPRFIGSLDIPSESVEGYLFPETYNLPRSAAPEAILRAMVDRFNAVYTAEFARRAEALGMTKQEVVTLASVIEKETGLASERPLISAVFHNRLKKGMRLQSDPTVIYGIRNFDGNLTRKHLETRSAYNTYVIAGLPPGPIASPGEASLRAALWPADDPSLYFVAKGDGSHVFSADLAAHNRNVARYQRGQGG